MRMTIRHDFSIELFMGVNSNIGVWSKTWYLSVDNSIKDHKIAVSGVYSLYELAQLGPAFCDYFYDFFRDTPSIIGVNEDDFLVLKTIAKTFPEYLHFYEHY